MVNLGRSKGCHTCKRRRVKCDEGRPDCGACLRLGLSCEGYEKRPPKLRFMAPVGLGSTTSSRSPTRISSPGSRQSDNEETSVCRRSRVKLAASVMNSPPTSLSPPTRDTALGFLLTYFANYGRHPSSSRGFWESVPLVLASEPAGSAATVAVTAVATSMFSLWRGNLAAFVAPSPTLGEALTRLQRALTIQHKLAAIDSADSNPIGVLSPVLASLALQFYNDILGQYDPKRPKSDIHHEGAIALLASSASRSNVGLAGSRLESQPASQLRTSLLMYMVHYAINGALFSTGTISPRLAALLGDYYRSGDGKTDFNPTERLDRIALGVVDLNHRFCHNPQTCSLAQAENLDTSLQAWPSHVPSLWFPLSVPSNSQGKAWHKSTVTSYPALDTYHVYPSVQVASIWNSWRILRLITLKVQLAAIDDCSESASYSSPKSDFFGTSPQSQATSESMQWRHDLQRTVQDQVDAICQSVPFYLGNRWHLASMSDFSNNDIILPSYGDLNMRSPGTASQYQAHIGSTEAHKGHVTATGFFHIRRTLGMLMTVLFTHNKGSLLVECLRPGQLEWIRQQLRRTAILMGVSG